MLRFCSLGSGSSGNALLVEAADGLFPVRILVDNGFGLRELQRRLARAGVVADDLAAVFVTHEHEDHASGVAACAARFNLPIYSTGGTARVAGFDRGIVRWQPLHGGRSVAIGPLQVRSLSVPHDAREPVQFVFSDGAAHLALLTDLGHPAPEVVGALPPLSALVLECNHDVQMLRAGPYSASLKARILGDRGHLSNQQAAQLLAGLDRSRLRCVVAAHLSRTNNRAELARSALAQVWGTAPDEVEIAHQNEGLAWRIVA